MSLVFWIIFMLYPLGLLASWYFGSKLLRTDYPQTWLDADFYDDARKPEKGVGILDSLHAAEIERIKEMEVRLFLEVPTASWLDPNRYGDNPDWRPVPKPKPVPKIAAPERPAPNCPVCGPAGRVVVMSVHAGEATMWDCWDCGAAFTRKGETAKSRKKRTIRLERRHLDALEPAELRRLSLSDTPLAEVYMHSAPAVIPYRPDRSLRITSRQLDDELISMHQMMQQASEDRLPCGCTGAIKRGREPYTGWWFSACETCGAEWEPPSNDSTGRRLAQGERVIYPPARPMR